METISYNKKYYLLNRETILKDKKEKWNSLNTVEYKTYRRNYYHKNKDKWKNNYEKNKEKIKEYNAEYYSNHKGKYIEKYICKKKIRPVKRSKCPILNKYIGINLNKQNIKITLSFN